MSDDLTTYVKEIADAIRPTVTSVYGESPAALALADDLAGRIADNADEDTIMRTCWMWFPGGTTAQTAARQIIAAAKSES